MQIPCAALNSDDRLKCRGTEWVDNTIFCERFVSPLIWIPVWSNELLYRNEFSKTGSVPFIKAYLQKKKRPDFVVRFLNWSLDMRYRGWSSNWIRDDACGTTRKHYEFKNTLYSLEIAVHVSMNNNNPSWDRVVRCDRTSKAEATYVCWWHFNFS